MPLVIKGYDVINRRKDKLRVSCMATTVSFLVWVAIFLVTVTVVWSSGEAVSGNYKGIWKRVSTVTSFAKP